MASFLFTSAAAGVLDCPADTGWQLFANATGSEDKCFYVLAEKLSQCKCEEQCQELSSSLACIETDAENTFVAEALKMVSQDKLGWIGLFRSDNKDDAKEGWNGWTTGCGSTYRNWSAGEPNNAGHSKKDLVTYREDCAAMRNETGVGRLGAPCLNNMKSPFTNQCDGNKPDSIWVVKNCAMFSIYTDKQQVLINT